MRASAAALNDENASLKLRLEVARKNEQKLEIVEGELRDFYSLECKEAIALQLRSRLLQRT